MLGVTRREANRVVYTPCQKKNAVSPAPNTTTKGERRSGIAQHSAFPIRILVRF
jgi:hypothetical protein